MLKALTANKAHHPGLITQFVEAGGPAKLLNLVGVGGALASECTQVTTAGVWPVLS